MFQSLKYHPFGVEAFFEKSIVLSYAAPAHELQRLLPPFLNVDAYNDYGFVAVALVKTNSLRPKGFPAFLGNDFWLVGYRVFVRYTDIRGRRLRGLYILKSETDKKRMELLGNLFTNYKYTTTDIKYSETGRVNEIKSLESEFSVRYEVGDNSQLPEHSPFENWKAARRFAGPLPFTFSTTAATNELLIIEGVRENWMPLPIKIHSSNFKFIEQLQLSKPVLANAFIVEHIPYSWKKGKIEKWC